MSEYAESHSAQKLFGAPPGYVGYEAGGQLTNTIKEHPFSLLLFDEIEKASPSIRTNDGWTGKYSIFFRSVDCVYQQSGNL